MFKKSAFKTPAIPEGQRVYAIGDIHGRADLLKKLLTLIENDLNNPDPPISDKSITLNQPPPNIQNFIVFLGDYIDRGPSVREALNLMRTGLPAALHPVYLRGNHEDQLLRLLNGNFSDTANWLKFGGEATLMSYGINPFSANFKNNFKNIQQALTTAMPAADIAFLTETQTSWICGDYYFVHAGIRPEIPLTEQEDIDLLWIRQEFLNSKIEHEKYIVHGHTISTAPEVLANRAGIDTGAYATGKLTCLKLEADTKHIFQT